MSEPIEHTQRAILLRFAQGSGWDQIELPASLVWTTPRFDLLCLWKCNVYIPLSQGWCGLSTRVLTWLDLETELIVGNQGKN